MDEVQMKDMQYDHIATLASHKNDNSTTTKVQALYLPPSNIVHPFTLQQIAKMQADDRVCNEGINWVTEGQPDITQLYDNALADLHGRFTQLRLIQDILYVDFGIKEPDLKIVVPLLMQREIIAASHVYLTAH